jgi:hypothetical protein
LLNPNKDSEAAEPKKTLVTTKPTAKKRKVIEGSSMGCEEGEEMEERVMENMNR